MMGGKLAKFFRDQPRAGAGERGDAVKVEDDKLRTRLGGELARDVVDVG